jgi:cyclophilin family peptidyl-prolyl cis-trans isomerase
LTIVNPNASQSLKDTLRQNFVKSVSETLKTNSNSLDEESNTKEPKILLQTSKGNITIQMHPDKPVTTQNFVKLVKQGLYDNTVFHRVIAGFMIQGGQISSSILSIPDEIGQNNRNIRGTIAMAKTSSPNSATSQFFINIVDNGNNVIDYLGNKFDSVYAAFGTVIRGMDVVDSISKVAVRPNPYTGENSQPIQTVTLIKATMVDKE